MLQVPCPASSVPAAGDLIYGGTGGDVLSGGAGADLFVFGAGDNGDDILDWNFNGARDSIDLRPVFDAGGYTGLRHSTRRDMLKKLIAEKNAARRDASRKSDTFSEQAGDGTPHEAAAGIRANDQRIKGQL